MSLDSPPSIKTELPEVLTVSALNQSVAKLLERHYALAWISGEVSNFTKAASGHWYFTLRDSAAQVRALMFRGRAQSVGFPIKDGDKIEVRATVTLYTARGDYQLNVESIRHAGVGNLYEAFVRLKEKLAGEGLFDAERKRDLPVFVRTIGIVTSPQAAALGDILTTLARRVPHVHIILYPTPVQGDAAVEKIVDAIACASARAECDLLLVSRGGGSMEDLWCFNDERVARAIVACSIPVISGVGHETDSTITDFVADLRAPTPTGAAEMATRTRADWINSVKILADDLQYAMQRILSNTAQNMDSLARRLIGPTTYIEREKLKLQSLCTRLSHANHTTVSASQYALQHLHTRLKAKRLDTRSHLTHLSTLSRQISMQMATRQSQQRQTLASLSERLELLNPQRTLERGYAIITDKRGRVVRSPKHLHTHEVISVRLAEGGAQVGVASVQPTLD